MTLPLQAIDHISDGATKILSQDRRAPRVLLRLGCVLNSIQRVEDQLARIHEAFRPAVATGFRLDWIGAKVSQARAGMVDALYRRFIQAKILANGSSGKVTTLQRIATILSTFWLYSEALGRVTFDVSMVQDLPTRISTRALLQQAAPAGVGVYYIQSGASGEQLDFEWATLVDGFAATRGFDTSVGNDSAGYFATIVGPTS